MSVLGGTVRSALGLGIHIGSSVTLGKASSSNLDHISKCEWGHPDLERMGISLSQELL